jgi:hypothetical protein
VEIIDLFIRSVDFIVFDPDAISLVGDVIETLAEPWDIGSATTMNFYASLDTTLTNMYEDKSFVAGVIDHVVAYCDALQIPLLEIYRAKTDFNKTRKDHSVEARQAVGGKQF